MFDYDVEVFPEFIMGVGSNRSFLDDFNIKINTTFDDWEKVKVPVDERFIDDFTSIRTYEYRYRISLGKVYELLGYDEWRIPNRLYKLYWEKKEDGTITDYPYNLDKRV